METTFVFELRARLARHGDGGPALSGDTEIHFIAVDVDKRDGVCITGLVFIVGRVDAQNSLRDQH